MSAVTRYCHQVVVKDAFNKVRKDVTADTDWYKYIRTVVDVKKFSTIFQEYNLAKKERGKEIRVHSDSKSIADGAFCMSLSLKRLEGGAQSKRVLTVYENNKPHPDKILVRGEFGTIDEGDIEGDAFSGQFFKRVLVDMLQQAGAKVVKDRNVDEID